MMMQQLHRGSEILLALAGVTAAILFANVIQAQDADADVEVKAEVKAELEQLRASVTGSGPHDTARLIERSGIHPDYDGATIHYPVGLEGPSGYGARPRVPVTAIGDVLLGPFLASHRIVTMTIGTNCRGDRRRIAPPHCSTRCTLEEEAAREGSPLFGRIDVDRIGVGGWSMGGGGARRRGRPDLDVVLALCPWKLGHSFDHPFR